MDLWFSDMTIDKDATIVEEVGGEAPTVFVNPLYDLSLRLKAQGKELVDHLWEGDVGDIERELEKRLACYRLRLCCPICGSIVIWSAESWDGKKCQSCGHELPLIGE